MDGWMIDNFCVVYQYPGETPIIKNTNAINLFPNPTQNELYITASYPIALVVVTNLLGQTVYTKDYNSEQVQVDVSDLPAGIYLVRINGSEVRKFVKE